MSACPELGPKLLPGLPMAARASAALRAADFVVESIRLENTDGKSCDCGTGKKPGEHGDACVAGAAAAAAGKSATGTAVEFVDVLARFADGSNAKFRRPLMKSSSESLSSNNVALAPALTFALALPFALAFGPAASVFLRSAGFAGALRFSSTAQTCLCSW